MVDNSSDSGYELILDNRRLIIAFIVLILFCGCFFVIGFVEGKRQGYQSNSQPAAESAVKPVAGETKVPERPAVAPDSGMPAVKENVEKQRLNWYKNVSGQEQKNEIAPPPAEPAPARKKETVKPAAVSEPAAQAGYTVQVGAFRQRQQVEVKAQLLRSKGFDCRIEVPQSPEGLYLLKVGQFKTRAEAVAVQLRLKENGIGSFIKTN
jgi:cell division protein FtsN